jgi:hypothetical protein
MGRKGESHLLAMIGSDAKSRFCIGYSVVVVRMLCRERMFLSKMCKVQFHGTLLFGSLKNEHFVACEYPKCTIEVQITIQYSILQ